jgi:hypothetical protein
MLTDPTMRSEPEVNPTAPDPGAARDCIAAFEAEHAAALTDANAPGHRHAVKERSRLYSAAFGSDPATGLDVGSDGADDVVEPRARPRP